MKPTLFFFLFLFLFNSTLLADNWELFPANQVTYFHFTGEYLDAISPFYVDYVESSDEADHQYILRNYIEELSGACYESFHTDEDWIDTGYRFPNEVMVHQNGWYGETTFASEPSSLPNFVFHAHANVGEKWLLENENYQDFEALQIECIGIEETAFLDVLDKVKTFQLQALKGGNPVESSFNQIQFKISEKYGLIQGVPLKELLQNAPTTNMQLKGFEDEMGVLHGRRAYTILDFVPEYSVGDILKWKFSGYHPLFEFKAYHRDSIVEVIKTDTSIGYNYVRVTNESQVLEFDEEHEYDFDTLYNQSKTYEYDLYKVPIDLLYYQLAIDEDKTISKIKYDVFPPFSYSLSLEENKYLNFNDGHSIGENCGVEYNTALIHKRIYIHPELGLIRESINPTETTSLIGYRIGDKEGGDIEALTTSIDVSIEEETYFAEHIKLYPNPTSNRFVLQLEKPKFSNLQLKVRDIHGQLILQESLFQPSIQVDLTAYSSGIYLIQVSDGKNWWTEKVVKY
ncbi:MAG: T9SS type A sorting domain-containing protein [Chitinophagales bacterium]